MQLALRHSYGIQRTFARLRKKDHLFPHLIGGFTEDFLTKLTDDTAQVTNRDQSAFLGTANAALTANLHLGDDDSVVTLYELGVDALDSANQDLLGASGHLRQRQLGQHRGSRGGLAAYRWPQKRAAQYGNQHLCRPFHTRCLLDEKRSLRALRRCVFQFALSTKNREQSLHVVA